MLSRIIGAAIVAPGVMLGVLPFKAQAIAFRDIENRHGPRCRITMPPLNLIHQTAKGCAA